MNWYAIEPNYLQLLPTTIYLQIMYVLVEHSGEVISGCRSHNANLFEP